MSHSWTATGTVPRSHVPQEGPRARLPAPRPAGRLPVEREPVVQIQACAEVPLLGIEGVQLSSTGPVLLPLMLPEG